jgi:hypothetical protein
MSSWTDYDPFTGMVEHNVADELTGKVTVHKEMDVEPLLDATKAIANSGATDIGIKKGLWHYCSIPLVVQYKLLNEYGINIHNQNHWPRMYDIINRDFPYLKTTHKHHAMKGGGQIFAARNNSPKPANSTKPGGSRIII